MKYKYKLGYGTFEESETLFLESDTKFSKDDLFDIMIKASKDRIKHDADNFEVIEDPEDIDPEDLDDEPNYFMYPHNIQDVVNMDLYPFLEKYGLHKVAAESSVFLFGWKSLEEEDSWTLESSSEDDRYSKEVGDYIKNLKGV